VARSVPVETEGVESVDDASVRVALRPAVSLPTHVVPDSTESPVSEPLVRGEPVVSLRERTDST